MPTKTVEAWRVIASFRHEPVALILTRQAVPTLDRTKYAGADGLRRGAYILADADDGRPQVLLLATGSEVALCVEAYEALTAEGIKARVVSMPSWEMFEHYCRRPPGVSRAGAAEVGQRARLGGKRVHPRLGPICRRRAVTASAWRPSAPPRRSRSCRRSSASLPRTSSPRRSIRSQMRGEQCALLGTHPEGHQAALNRSAVLRSHADGVSLFRRFDMSDDAPRWASFLIGLFDRLELGH